MEKRNIQIERNVIENAIMVAKDFIKKHRLKVVYALLAILLLFTALVSAYLYYEHRAKKEMVKYEEIMERYRALERKEDASPTALAMTIGEMKSLVDASKWGFVHSMGDYILGGMYFKNKNYDDARRHYVKFADANPKSDFSILAIQKAAMAMEYSGNYDDALQLYRKLEDQHGNSSYSDQIYYDCARMYQKRGNFFKAKEYFRKVITSNPRSIFSLRSRHRLFLLSYQEKNVK
jgi:tetratricopeptide (TPR) repeat protein